MEVSNRILVLQASAVSKITKTENKSQYSSFRILSLKKSTRENLSDQKHPQLQVWGHDTSMSFSNRNYFP